MAPKYAAVLTHGGLDCMGDGTGFVLGVGGVRHRCHWDRFSEPRACALVVGVAGLLLIASVAAGFLDAALPRARSHPEYRLPVINPPSTMGDRNTVTYGVVPTRRADQGTLDRAIDVLLLEGDAMRERGRSLMCFCLAMGVRGDRRAARLRV